MLPSRVYLLVSDLTPGFRSDLLELLCSLPFWLACQHTCPFGLLDSTLALLACLTAHLPLLARFGFPFWLLHLVLHLIAPPSSLFLFFLWTYLAAPVGLFSVKLTTSWSFGLFLLLLGPSAFIAWLSARLPFFGRLLGPSFLIAPTWPSYLVGLVGFPPCRFGPALSV